MSGDGVALVSDDGNWQPLGVVREAALQPEGVARWSAEFVFDNDTRPSIPPLTTTVTVKPAAPIGWHTPPRRTWRKRVLAKLLRLPKPTPVPIYPERARSITFDYEGSDGAQRRLYMPHAIIERSDAE